MATPQTRQRTTPLRRVQLPASGPLAAVPRALDDAAAAAGLLVESLGEESPEPIRESAAAFRKTTLAAAQSLRGLHGSLASARQKFDAVDLENPARMGRKLAERNVPRNGFSSATDRQAAVTRQTEDAVREVVADSIESIEQQFGEAVASAAKTCLDRLKRARTAATAFGSSLRTPDSLVATTEERQLATDLRGELEGTDVTELVELYRDIRERLRIAREEDDAAGVSAAQREELIFRIATRSMLSRLANPQPRVLPNMPATSPGAREAATLLKAFAKSKGQDAEPLTDAAEEICSRLERIFVLLAGRDLSYSGPFGVDAHAFRSALDAGVSKQNGLSYDANAIKRALYRTDQIAFDSWTSSILAGLNRGSGT
jgi:hypothetical protein